MKYNIKEQPVEQTMLPMDTIFEVVSVKQVVHEKPVDYDTHIRSSMQAATFGMKEIGDEASECVMMLALSTKNKIIAMHKVFAGSLNSSVAHPREIFRTAILNNAARIMLFHNHPSGDTEPSIADHNFTKRLNNCGEMLGIELLDHIIVTAGNHYSFREHGHL